MTEIPTFEVNAFVGPGLSGNPAAVCLLDHGLEDEAMLAIAKRHNLSETAFLVAAGPGDDFDYHLRWFTPEVEVDLCGHATLATAHVLFNERGFEGREVRFLSPSGLLSARSEGQLIWLDFPSRKPLAATLPAAVLKAIGGAPKEVLLGQRDYLLVYGDQAEVEALGPDFETLGDHGLLGYIATATGRQVDFVSRCFFPAYGIDEDPVTGSAHCVSGPYWAEKLGRNDIRAHQISPRGGELALRIVDDRTLIGGRAETVRRGEIQV